RAWRRIQQLARAQGQIPAIPVQFNSVLGPAVVDVFGAVTDPIIAVGILRDSQQVGTVAKQWRGVVRVKAVGAAPDSAVNVGVRDPTEEIFGQRVEMPVASAAAAHGVKNIPVFHVVAGADHAVESDQTIDVKWIVDWIGGVGTPRVPEISMEQTVIVPQLMAG